MTKFKIVILDDRYKSFEEEFSVLSELQAEILIERSLNEKDLINAVKDVDAIIVNLTPITANIVSQMNRCKCISRYGVGYDNVDLKALKQRNIYLANVPDYCDEDVSDHALALMLDCIRKISCKDSQVRKGLWNLTNIQPVHRICSKVFGFVGYGNIAKCLRRKLVGFNLSQMLIYDPFISDGDIQRAGAKQVDLKTLCKQSDYISIHTPLLDSTRSMIDQEHFNIMKPTTILINTSRGPVVNQAALIDALKTGKIACAGLDVFEHEPIEEDNELKKLKNVVLTDHAGWYSEESIKELKTKAAQNILDVLKGKKPKYLVQL